jgi:hypothetical protein
MTLGGLTIVQILGDGRENGISGVGGFIQLNELWHGNGIARAFVGILLFKFWRKVQI